MADPTVAASLDKAVYVGGETMTLTVTYEVLGSRRVAVTITVADEAGNISKPVTATAVIAAATVVVEDSSGRAWAQRSDTGMVAVFTAVA